MFYISVPSVIVLNQNHSNTTSLTLIVLLTVNILSVKSSCGFFSLACHHEMIVITSQLLSFDYFAHKAIIDADFPTLKIAKFRQFNRRTKAVLAPIFFSRDFRRHVTSLEFVIVKQLKVLEKDFKDKQRANCVEVLL